MFNQKRMQLLVYQVYVERKTHTYVQNMKGLAICIVYLTSIR